MREDEYFRLLNSQPIRSLLELMGSTPESSPVNETGKCVNRSTELYSLTLTRDRLEMALSIHSRHDRNLGPQQ